MGRGRSRPAITKRADHQRPGSVVRPLADQSSSKCVRRIRSEGGRTGFRAGQSDGRRPTRLLTDQHQQCPPALAVGLEQLAHLSRPGAVSPPRPPAPLEALRGPRPGARAPVHPTPAVGHRRRLTRRAPPRACPAPRRCGEIPAWRAILQPAAVSWCLAACVGSIAYF